LHELFDRRGRAGKLGSDLENQLIGANEIEFPTSPPGRCSLAYVFSNGRHTQTVEALNGTTQLTLVTPLTAA
jgi:hypothetical protein